MKALCFVLMPFGTKPDDQGHMINFDAVYEQVIAPAVVKADLDGVRADEERVGGTIHKPMFERLMLCEYAIADLTIANPNVYYELGIRHAMRPRSTVLLNRLGTRLPFDISLARAMPYQLGADGRPSNAAADAQMIADQLIAMDKITTADSPIFQLIDGLKAVDLAHMKTDVFRDRALYSTDIRDQLQAARNKPKEAALAAIEAIAAEPDLRHVANVDAGVIVDLLLSYRAAEGYRQMAALYERAAPELQHATIMQEQYAFALNRMGRGDEAERILLGLIQHQGPSSETNGLLGPIYKDRYEAARDAGRKYLAAGELRRAIDAYVAGFEADWRDAYPGVNAVTLMDMLETPDPRQKAMLPVVRYAASRRTTLPNADYWDYATMLELAVLMHDPQEAFDWLSRARAAEQKEAWKIDSTKKNMGLIRARRVQRGDDIDWLAEIEAELQDASDKINARA